MCGRFTLHHTTQEVIDRFGVLEVLFEFPERYNIAPGQPIAVITQNAHGDGIRALEGYRWGLVPAWAKDESMASKMIHARSEIIAEKPSYRNLMKRRRCLIPTDGFYEWKPEGKEKTPHHIRFTDGRLYSFNGLWDEWNGPGDAPLRTCTMITCAPNDLLSTLHHRMSVILPRELEDLLLDPNLETAEALAMLQTYPDKELEAFPVNRRVGNVSYDVSNLIMPLQPTQNLAQGQLNLF